MPTPSSQTTDRGAIEKLYPLTLSEAKWKTPNTNQCFPHTEHGEQGECLGISTFGLAPEKKATKPDNVSKCFPKETWRRSICTAVKLQRGEIKSVSRTFTNTDSFMHGGITSLRPCDHPASSTPVGMQPRNSFNKVTFKKEHLLTSGALYGKWKKKGKKM